MLCELCYVSRTIFVIKMTSLDQDLVMETLELTVFEGWECIDSQSSEFSPLFFFPL
jgi:hypothetical protein